MKIHLNCIPLKFYRFFLIALFSSISLFLNATEINSNEKPEIKIEEGLDSLLIAVQEVMLTDTTLELLEKESLMLEKLMTDYEDFYSLTKNLFLLDYNLERKEDYVSRSILRYWMGYYMKSQKLMDNAMELWNGIEFYLPAFLIPDLYLNKGEVLSSVEEYANAIYYFKKVDELKNSSDSILWSSKVQLANVYKYQEKYQDEIDEWLNTITWLENQNRFDWNIFAFKSLADSYRNIGEYGLSITNLNRANDYHQSYNPNSPGLYQYYVDIALIFELQENKSKALSYLKTASKEMRKENNSISEAEISYRIASIYFGEGEYDKAKEYNDKASRISDNNNYEELLLRTYYLSYEINKKRGFYKEALDDYAKYSEINQRFVEDEKEIIKDTYQKQYQIERAEKQYKLIIASEELKDFELDQFRLEKEAKDARISLLEEQQVKIDLNNELEKKEEKNRFILKEQKSQAEKHVLEIEVLEGEKQLNKMQLDEQRAKELADQQEIENLTQENKNNELELELEIGKRNRVRWFSVFIIIIVVLLVVFLWTKVKANRELSDKNQEIAYQHREIEIKNKRLAKEKDKTDSLLLNILPQETAEELKSTGKALPKIYESVSILFTDFAGFTSLTEKMAPLEVLNNLELMFTRFDDIANENEMERIKTIGDGYMCAGGLPVVNETHALNAVRTGLEYIKATEVFNLEQKKLGLPEWNLRLGINTGKVVAGVIGKRKFAYDIWGDSVNLASRAESHGVLNKVNITENTFLQIKDVFECEYRGEIDVKNIGKVKMYIVIGEKG